MRERLRCRQPRGNRGRVAMTCVGSRHGTVVITREQEECQRRQIVASLISEFPQRNVNLKTFDFYPYIARILIRPKTIVSDYRFGNENRCHVES